MVPDPRICHNVSIKNEFGLMTAEVAIIAALEREVWPFVKYWPTTRKEYDGRSYKFFEKEHMVVVCGGIGSEAARRATEAAINFYHPALVISAGFAGALVPALSSGDTLTPRHVIDASDGSRTDSDNGEGVLVSFGTIADVEQKAKLAKVFGAHAVDMEAAAVAKAAQAHGINFLACKVISDPSDARLPPIARFVGEDGRFHLFKFISYIVLRPRLWASVRRLMRDSAIAATQLGEALARTSKAAVPTSNAGPVGCKA